MILELVDMGGENMLVESSTGEVFPLTYLEGKGLTQIVSHAVRFGKNSYVAWTDIIPFDGFMGMKWSLRKESGIYYGG